MVRQTLHLTRKSMALLTSLLLVLFWVPGLIAASPASAATDAGFEIDGDATPQSALDWNSAAVTGSANFHVVHDNSPTDTTSFGSSNKESADPSTWTNSGAGAQHSDIVDVFTYSHNGDVGGQSHAFLDFAFTRNSPNGTDGYFIELDKNGNITHTLNGVPISYPDRSGGAVRFQMKEQGNSTMALLSTKQWNTSTNVWEDPTTVDTTGFDSAVSTGSVTPPDSGTFPADSFIEVSLDLTKLVGVSPDCPPPFGYVNFRSYTGNSDENLQDYVNGFKAPAASTCSSLTIVKTDDTSAHNPLGGATFHIVPNPIPGVTGPAAASLDITDNTSAADVDPNDADPTVGTILIDPALPNATGYSITETGAPTGYLTGTATVDGPYVAPDSAAGPTVTFRDPLGTATWTKLDSFTNAALAGATFEVKATAGAALTTFAYDELVTDGGTADATHVADASPADGTIEVADLYTGEYDVTEFSPPGGSSGGYNSSSATLHFKINDAHPGGEWTTGTSFTDTRKTVSLTVIKQAAGTTCDPANPDPTKCLSGATFHLFRLADGNTAPNTPTADTDVANCTTDSTGSCSRSVVWGPTYYWVETAAPAGYNLPADPVGALIPLSTYPGTTGPVTRFGDLKPTIATAATDAAIGSSINDVATLHNLRSDSTGTVTFSVYGPFDLGTTITTNSCVNPSAGVTGNRVGTWTVTVHPADIVNLSVSYASDAEGHIFTPGQAGEYAWVASYSGDTKTAAATGVCGDGGETSTVNPKQPTMNTVATDTHTVLGTFHDDAYLHDFAAPTHTLSVTFTLYTTNNCAAGTDVFTSTNNVDATGHAISGDYTATNQYGTYYWKATLNLNGDVNNTTTNIGNNCGLITADPNGNHEVSTAPVIPDPTKAPTSGTVRVYAPDNTIHYTVTVQNTGGATASGVSLTDVAPAGTTFTSNDGCTFSLPAPGQNQTCAFTQPLPDQTPTWTFDLAAGGSVAIHLTVTANSGDTDGQLIHNHATVHSGAYNKDTNITTHTVIRPLLALGKNANPLPVEDAPSAGTVAPGQTITYTLPLSNTGSDAANGVVVTDTVPVHTTYNGANPAHCENHTTHATITCSVLGPPPSHSGANPDVVTWHVDVAAHTTVDVVFSVVVDPKASLTNGDQIPNQGSFTWTYSAQSGGPNLTGQSRSIHHVVTFPVLTQDKTATPLPRDINGDGGVVHPTPSAGSTIHYVVTVHNSGQAAATGVSVTDAVPTGTTYNLLSAVPALNAEPPVNNLLSWTIDVPAGGSTQVAFDVTVNAGDTDGQLINNTAVVNGVDTNTTTHIVEIPIMSVVKSSNPTTGTSAQPALVGPNTVITYTLTVTNAGRQDATGFVVSDTVPTGTTYNDDASCNGASNCAGQEAGGVVTWTLDVPGGTVSNNVVTPTTRTLTFSVTTPTVQSFLIDNTASFPNIHTPDCIPSGETNCDTNTTHHEVVFPVINAVKTSDPVSGTQANPTTVAPGQVITYTIAVTNSGEADAKGVVVHDSVPANTTYVAGSADATGGNVSAGVITWTVDVAKGTTVNLTFKAQVPAGATNGQLIDNTATFTNVHTPSCTGETCSTDATHHEVRFPILTLAKSSNPVSGSIVQRGDRIDYTITLANSGLDASAPTTITDTLPSYVTIVSGSANPAFTTVNGNVVTWMVTVPAGQTKTLTYGVTVNSDAPEGATLTNVALVNGQCVGNADESACTTDHHVPTGDLTLVKHVDKTTAAYGDTLTYTFEASTTGALDQTGVVVTDVLPKGTAYVNSSAACTDAGTCTASFDTASKTVTWQLGDMAAGTTRHLVFKVTIVKPSFNSTTGLPATTIVNSGAVQSNETPNTPSNQVVTKVVAVLGVKVVRAPVLAFTGLPAQVLMMIGLLMLGAGVILTSVRRREQ